MKRQDGFTLTELLVSISLSSIAAFLMITAVIYTYGYMYAEQAKAEMTRNSQVFLSRIAEDLRIGNTVLAAGVLPDTYAPTGGWVTSDPADTLILGVPATDENNEFVIDPNTGDPYQQEIVYFGDDEVMYRRTIVDANSVTDGAVQVPTCPLNTAGCRADSEITKNLDSLLFTFYDINGAQTTDPTQAQSIEVTINLKRGVYGRELNTTNSARMTLRNAN